MSELDPGDKASPSREAVQEAAGSETEELLVTGTSTGGLSTGGAVGLSTGSDSGAQSVTTSDILESPASTVGVGRTGPDGQLHDIRNIGSVAHGTKHDTDSHTDRKYGRS